MGRMLRNLIPLGVKEGAAENENLKKYVSHSNKQSRLRSPLMQPLLSCRNASWCRRSSTNATSHRSRSQFDRRSGTLTTPCASTLCPQL